MPNAMNKFRPKQMVKVEKENENQVIKRKQKVTPRDRHSKGPEPIRERPNKTQNAKRCPNNDDEPSYIGSKKSTIMLLSGTSGRLASLRTLAPPTALLPVGVPRRTMYSSNHMDRSVNLYGTQPTRARGFVTKSFDKSEKKNKKREDPLPVLPIEEKLSYMCMAGRSVKDLLTARSICNSKSSSDRSNISRRQPRHSSAHSIRDTHSSGSSRYFSQMSECDLYDLREYSDITMPESRRQSITFRTQDCEATDECKADDENTISARGSLNSSVRIITNFRDLLRRKQKSMRPDEIDVIKDVVKTDERHCQLKPNHEESSNLIKDILRTQLQEILRQEIVVKSALNKLDSKASMALLQEGDVGADTSELHIEDERERGTHVQSLSEPNVLYATKSILQMQQQQTPDDDEKPKVDVIFKNVPTLEKEIIILRALGEKLEATLKRTNVNKQSAMTSTTNMNFGKVSTTGLLNDEAALAQSTQTGTMATSVMLQLCVFECRTTTEKHAVQWVQLLGLREMLGIVNEFRIVQKTIVELKEEEHRQFFLPINDAKTELKRTCFTKLKQQPDVLMRHLRPKSANASFNVLDQDAIFFNSFLFGNSSQSQPQIASVLPDTPQRSLTSIDYVKRSKENLHEGGDSRPKVVVPCHSSSFHRSESDQLVSNRRISVGDADILDTTPMPSSEVDALSEGIGQMGTIVRKHRRRLRHGCTPMPLHKTLEPKNHLLKTILVGSMQVSIFLLLIMAVTYPEAKC